MKKNTYHSSHSRFPVKKCAIASVVILIVASIVLALIYSVVVNKEALNEKSWIFLLVWGIVFGGLLIGYWVVALFRYIKTRKDEN